MIGSDFELAIENLEVKVMIAGSYRSILHCTTPLIRRMHVVFSFTGMVARQ